MRKLKGGELRLNVHNAVEWVTVEKLGRYEFMPADIEFVEKLLIQQK
jgi:8-oxo-dGTP diphosphatase